MIFAFLEDGTLEVCDGLSEAQRRYEGIDVESGTVTFYNEDGVPLEACFTSPNRHRSFFGLFRWTTSGVYTLRANPHAAQDAFALALHETSALAPNPFFASIDQLKLELSGRGVAWVFVPCPADEATLPLEELVSRETSQQCVEYRLTVRSAAGLFLTGSFFAIMLIVAGLLSHPTQIWALLLGAGISALLIVARSVCRVRLTPRHLEVRTLFRTVRIPWTARVTVRRMAAQDYWPSRFAGPLTWRFVSAEAKVSINFKLYPFACLRDVMARATAAGWDSDMNP